MDGKKYAGHFYACMTIVIWGTTYVSTKILLTALSPIEILFLRFAVGFIALMLLYPHRLKLADRKQEWIFAAAGLCGVTLFFLLQNIALTHTQASNVGIIITIAPFFTAVFSYLFADGEKPRLPFFIGFILAFIGIVLVSAGGSGGIRINPLGDLLTVLAAAIWAVYLLLMKRISGYRYHTVQVTRRIFFYGLLFMLPALFVFGFQPDLEQLMGPVNLFNILFLGLGASALCFVTWNSAVKILGPVKTSVYIYLVPAVTVLSSVIVLRETITALVALGAALTLAGLIISENKFGLQRRRRLENG